MSEASLLTCFDIKGQRVFLEGSEKSWGDDCCATLIRLLSECAGPLTSTRAAGFIDLDIDLSSNHITDAGLRVLVLGLEASQSSHIKKLMLNRNKITVLPCEVCRLSTLTMLQLKVGQISELPAEIGRLRALEELSLGGNKLVTLPAGIGQFRVLKKLLLPFNQITHLPPEVGELHALKSLALAANQLRTLPSEMCSLRALIELWLDGNEGLTEIPGWIWTLPSLMTVALPWDSRGPAPALPLDKELPVVQTQTIAKGTAGSVHRTSRADVLAKVCRFGHQAWNEASIASSSASTGASHRSWALHHQRRSF